jgi:uncharacterized protein
MSYVKLKHTLSAVALGAIERPDDAHAVVALRAYARRRGEPHGASLASLARATGMAPDAVGRALLGTGLFEPVGGVERGRVALAAPHRPFVAYLRRHSARTAAALRRLRAPRPAGIPEEIWRAAALFDAGLFFECHEYLEDVWRSAQGPERAFYHGLVQAAAGCYHLEKANVHGARTLIRKAIAKLEPYAPAHRGVRVDAFLAGLRPILARLEHTKPSGGLSRAALPTLDLVGVPRRRQGRLRARGPGSPARASSARRRSVPVGVRSRRERFRRPGIPA